MTSVLTAAIAAALVASIGAIVYAICAVTAAERATARVHSLAYQLGYHFIADRAEPGVKTVHAKIEHLDNHVARHDRLFNRLGVREELRHAETVTVVPPHLQPTHGGEKRK